MDLLNKPLLSSLLLLLLLYLVKSQDMLNAVSYSKRKSQTGYDSETYNVKLRVFQRGYTVLKVNFNSRGNGKSLL